jgi:hypothetical protein
MTDDEYAPPEGVPVMWAISSGSYSSYRVHCVCPTREEAETVRDRLNGEPDDGWSGDYDIEWFALIGADTPFRDGLHLHLTMNCEGEIVEETERHTAWYTDLNPYDAVDCYVGTSPDYLRPGPNGLHGARIQARGWDHERVRKAYNEHRARLIADPTLRYRKPPRVEWVPDVAAELARFRASQGNIGGTIIAPWADT